MEGLNPGRIVHYVAYGTPGGEYEAGACRAAIITAIPTQGSMLEQARIALCVFNPTGVFFNNYVPYSEEKKPGTWHWPERA